MGLFSRSQRDACVVAIFDIDSASVGAALVRLSAREGPRILRSSRFPIRFHAEFRFDGFFAGMESALRSAVGYIEALQGKISDSAGGGRMEEIHVFFGAPWYLAQARKISWTRKDATTIKESALRKLLLEEEKSFKTSALAKSAPQLMGEASLIERVMLGSEINGYFLTSPAGKRGSRLSLSVFSSLLSERVFRSVSDIVENFFPHKTAHFHTYPLALSGALGEILPEVRDYLLITIGGEVSEIFLFRNGAFVESAYFPCGTYTLVRILTRGGGLSKEQARELLTRSAAAHVAPAEEDRMALAGIEWSTEFTATLRMILRDEENPPALLVVGEDGSERFAASLLAENAYLRGAAGGETPLITPLTDEFLRKKVGAVGGSDTYLVLHALFLNARFRQGARLSTRAASALSAVA